MSTKAELQATLTAANVEFPKRANKAALQALCDALPPKPERKQRVSTKAILRSLFANVGDEMLVADVVAHVQSEASVQAATITTMLGDLKNEKYAAGPTINITREGDKYVRVS